MSTIKVTNIQHASASTAAIALNSDGQATLNGLNFPTAGPLSNRNLIINGAMQVSQRGTSFTSQTGSAYFLDRFTTLSFNLGTGVYQVDQGTDAPDGFQNSLKLSCTTADTTTDANGQLSVYQALEGLDTNFLKYFQASPDTVTLSFYVKSNRTGSFSASLRLSDNGSSFTNSSTRSYNFTYSISTADTWERKTVSITLDSSTSETKVVNNRFAVAIQWWQLAGTSRDNATADSWGNNSNQATASDNLDLLESTDNNWFITGVQLEVGSVATPFEHRSYGDELMRCYRYYYKLIADTADSFGVGVANVGTIGRIDVRFPTEMNDVPDLETSGTAGDYRIGYRNSEVTCTSVPSVSAFSKQVARVAFTVSDVLTAGDAIDGRSTGAGHYLAFDAEL